MKNSFCFSLTFLFYFNCCLSQEDSSIVITDSAYVISFEKLDSIIDNGKTYLGIKYVYAGRSPSGFDCSGLIHYMFKAYGIRISGTSLYLSKMGHKIPFEKIQKGDLLFFKERDMSTSAIGHVAICTENKEGCLKMLHATKSGVMVDVFNEKSYYPKRYLFAIRFLKIF